MGLNDQLTDTELNDLTCRLLDFIEKLGIRSSYADYMDLNFPGDGYVDPYIKRMHERKQSKQVS